MLDTEGADETRAYRIKLSKWYQGTFDCIQHPIFWYLIAICRCLRGPLRHFFAFVLDNARQRNSGRALLQLVTGKLDELHDEFRVLSQNIGQIITGAMEMSGCDRLFADDPDGKASLALIAQKVLFQQWSSFQRRILYPLQQLLVVSMVGCIACVLVMLLLVCLSLK